MSGPWRQLYDFQILLLLLQPTFGQQHVSVDGYLSTYIPSSIEGTTGTKIRSYVSSCLSSIFYPPSSRTTLRESSGGDGSTKLPTLDFEDEDEDKRMVQRDFSNAWYTALYETIDREGPGTVYQGCDGIARYAMKGEITAVRTRTVTATHRYQEILTGGLTSRASPNTTSTTIDMYYPPEQLMPLPDCPVHLEIVPEGPLMCSSLVMDHFKKAVRKEYNANAKEDDCVYQKFCSIDIGEEILLLYWPEDSDRETSCLGSGLGNATSFGRSLVKTSLGTSKATIVTLAAITFEGQHIQNKGGVFDDGTMRRTYDESWTDSRTITGPQSTVITGPFTFTSPTVYVAHRHVGGRVAILATGYVTFSNGTSSVIELRTEFTSSRSGGIFPVRTEEVFSIRPKRGGATMLHGTQWAQSIAAGRYGGEDLTNALALSWTSHVGNQVSLEATVVWTSLEKETVPFNFNDLRNPVPASAYFEARPDCWGIQTHCGTIVDDTYRPVLSINNSFWSALFDKEYGCSINTVVDPPIALTPIAMINVPKLPFETPPPIASLTVPYLQVTQPPNVPMPGSGIKPWLPQKTGQAGAYQFSKPLKGEQSVNEPDPAGLHANREGNSAGDAATDSEREILGAKTVNRPAYFTGNASGFKLGRLYDCFVLVFALWVVNYTL